MSALAPMPVDRAISDRLTGETLRSAILRAYAVGELTISEIACEFGCSESHARKIIYADVLTESRRNCG